MVDPNIWVKSPQPLAWSRLGSEELSDYIRENTRNCEAVVRVHEVYIVFETGSGGTLAGTALSIRLSKMDAQVHAICVCDTPQDVYYHIDLMIEQLHLDKEQIGDPRERVNI